MKKKILFLVLFSILQSVFATVSALPDFCDSWWVGMCLKNRAVFQDIYFEPEYRALKFDPYYGKILNVSKFSAKGDSLFDFPCGDASYPKLNGEGLKRLVGSAACFTFIYEENLNGYVVFYTLPNHGAIECFVEGLAFYEDGEFSLYGVPPCERGFDFAERFGSLRYVDNFRLAKNSSNELFEHLFLFNYSKDSDAKSDYIEEQIISFAKIKYFVSEKDFWRALNKIRVGRIIGEFDLKDVGKPQEEALLAKLNSFTDKIKQLEGPWILNKPNKKDCPVYSYSDRYGGFWFYMGRDKKTVSADGTKVYTYKFYRIDFDFDAELGFCFSLKKYEAPFIKKGENFSAKVGKSNLDHKFNLKDVFYIPIDGFLSGKNSISCLNKEKNRKIEIVPCFSEIKEFFQDGENWVLQSVMKKVIDQDKNK